MTKSWARARPGVPPVAVLLLVFVVLSAIPLSAGDGAGSVALSGRWAFLQVTSQIGSVPFAGERTRATKSLGLVDLVQDGLRVGGSESACFSAIDYGTSLVAAEIPDAFVRSMRPVTWTATLESDGIGARFERPWITSVNGAQLADPENEPLPTQADDPRVIDQDGDGKPGLTIRIAIMGFLSGDVYVVQRDRSRLVGVVTSLDTIEGLVEWTSEQSVLGASSSIFLGGAAAHPDPNPAHSYFRARRVDDSFDCASLREVAEELFDL